MASTKEPGIIRKLDEVVVNRIAAGEVVQRPANALKEMVENSLDAKSSSISVTVKQGGLKLLQIQDNGSGIRRDDMTIVCERFTTSKLKSFEDLTSIATYGFRGEALASISHVAHVTITTRTADSKCAFKGQYSDGKLKEPVKPCAGNQGTQITVEDVFYNVPTRRKALRSASEEHSRIFEVISRYAIHNCGVGFSLKKQGEAGADLRTAANSTARDNIRTVFGPSLAKELLDLENTDSSLKMTVKGLVSNANYSAKRCTMLLFINHRLVESTALKRALETVYATYLPKAGHPFLYLSVELAPETLDVNVHPTKHEVHFLHEERVIESVQKALDDRLLGANASRTYFTQTLLPGAVAVDEETAGGDSTTGDKPLAPQHMVRVDSREQKLDAFFKRPPSEAASANSQETPESTAANSGDAENKENEPSGSGDHQGAGREAAMDCDDLVEASDASPEEGSYDKSSRTASGSQRRRNIKLSSILNIRQRVEDNTHESLRGLVRDHKFVGLVSEEQSLLQHQTKLYLANTRRLSRELFYQILLYDFGNFGFLRLSEPAPLRDLALIALDSPGSGWKETDGPKSGLADYIVDLLQRKREMLDDYFSLQIDQEGRLCSLPLLLENYSPPLSSLPMLVLRLATEVEWDSEEACFETVCRELSEFYSVKPDPLCEAPQALAESQDKQPEPWRWTQEHVIIPAVRKWLLPPKTMAEDASFLQIAALPDLYKVFERC